MANRLCARGGCGTPIVARRSTKRFCSTRCAQIVSKGLKTTLSTSAGEDIAPETRNAMTSTNAKQRNAVTRADENVTSSGATARKAGLIRHIEAHYTRDQLVNDLDCVLLCCRSSQEWDEVLAAGERKARELKIHTKLRVPAKPQFATTVRTATEPKPMLRWVVTLTCRNVRAGKQGRCDLERYEVKA